MSVTPLKAGWILSVLTGCIWRNTHALPIMHKCIYIMSVLVMMVQSIARTAGVLCMFQAVKKTLVIGRRLLMHRLSNTKKPTKSTTFPR
ncbi:MAG: hypothetical protein Q4A69_02505 [Moraxella sp.]|nr:hypothetical protein [Moraxella sp.]